MESTNVLSCRDQTRTISRYMALRWCVLDQGSTPNFHMEVTIVLHLHSPMFRGQNNSLCCVLPIKIEGYTVKRSRNFSELADFF